MKVYFRSTSQSTFSRAEINIKPDFFPFPHCIQTIYFLSNQAYKSTNFCSIFSFFFFCCFYFYAVFLLLCSYFWEHYCLPEQVQTYSQIPSRKVLGYQTFFMNQYLEIGKESCIECLKNKRYHQNCLAYENNEAKYKINLMLFFSNTTFFC